MTGQKQKIKNQLIIQSVIGPSGNKTLGSLLRDILLMRELAEAARKEAEELGAKIPEAPACPKPRI